MNVHAVRAIYLFEMARTRRTLLQSIVAPVISTSLYFVVFGAAIGSRIQQVDDVTYGAFIVPGPHHAVAADPEHRQRVLRHLLSALRRAPSTSSCRRRSRPFEIVLSYVGAAATKSLILGLIILATAATLRPAAHRAPVLDAGLPGADGGDVQPVRLHHRLWADGFEKLQLVPLLIITPLTFLGGSFYSIRMLPPFWQTVTLFNPVVYLISAFRWSFFGQADVHLGVSVAAILLVLALCLGSSGGCSRRDTG